MTSNEARAMIDASSHNHPTTSATLKIKLEQDELSDYVGYQSKVKVTSEVEEFDDVKSSVDEQSTDESSDDEGMCSLETNPFKLTITFQ